MIRSLPMTENEIRVMYRDAKNKNKQIQILADMNGCGISDIRKVLGLSVKNENKKASNTGKLTGVKITTPQTEREFYVKESVDYIERGLRNITFGNENFIVLTKVLETEQHMPLKHTTVTIAPNLCSQLEFWESGLPVEDDTAIGLTD